MKKHCNRTIIVNYIYSWTSHKILTLDSKFCALTFLKVCQNMLPSVLKLSYSKPEVKYFLWFFVNLCNIFLLYAFKIIMSFSHHYSSFRTTLRIRLLSYINEDTAFLLISSNTNLANSVLLKMLSPIKKSHTRRRPSAAPRTAPPSLFIPLISGSLLMRSKVLIIIFMHT